MMDVLSELQGYYSMAGTINMDERKMRFQKLSNEAQEFATDFESLIRQKVSLENIIEKLGKKFPEKGITNLYYTYLKVAGTVEDTMVIDAVFEQKTEYVIRMMERERMRNRFRKMAKKDEGQLAIRVIDDIEEVKQSLLPPLKQQKKFSAPEVLEKVDKTKNPLDNIWVYIGLSLLAFMIIYFLFK
jgi:5'-3' exonuclease